MPYSVPPALSPYVTPAPQGSLTLVTSVLDAVSNWLLLRYVHAALEDNTVDKTHGGGDVLASDIGNHLQEDFNVIFVSVLRGFEQWREMGKKLVRGLPSYAPRRILAAGAGAAIIAFHFLLL
jgi:elongator complex protein 6